MVLQLSPKKIKTVALDYAKSAALVELQYVTDQQPGIERIKKGKGFIYLYEGKRITDTEELIRIKRLVIPPAWKKIWICKCQEGHLQATGLDARGRKQYRYHQLWASLRNQTKFYRLYEFGLALGNIRERIGKDLSGETMNEKKVLALILRLIDETGIRIGNGEYEKLNGSYGLSTLKDHHVSFKNGNTIRFIFKGKKGIQQNISVRSKKLARLVKQCRDIPGKELFQYYDENGAIRKVDSGMVNQYIKEITGENFTAKDFRTWTGTVHALHHLIHLELPESKTACNKRIIETLDYVATQLGNTRTVCKKYYVHPILFEWFENGSMSGLDTREVSATLNNPHLNAEEKMLLMILEEAMHKKISVVAD